MNNFFLAAAFLFLVTGFASAQQKSEYVYTGGGAVNGFAVNPMTGGLTAVPGSPFPAPALKALAISPAGDFLFAGDTGITVEAINPTTGALISVPGSPFATDLIITALVAAPNGRYLYAGAGTSIYTFSIDGNVGAITPIDSPVSLSGVQATSFAMTPGGGLLYAGTASNLLGFTVNAKSGALSPISMDITGTSPVINSDGYLYTIYDFVFGTGTEIGAYSISPTSGQLTPVAGSPFTAVYTSTLSLALDRTGKYLYQTVSNVTSGADAVAGYTLNTTTGVLGSQVPGSPFTTAAGFPVGLAVDRSNRFVYTTDGGASTISGFMRNGSTGSLTTIPGLLLNTSVLAGTLLSTVPQPASTATLRALAVKPVNPTVNIATTSTEQFLAVGEYSDGTQRFLTASVTWTSLTPSVATISNTPGQQGLATVLSSGATQITATLDGFTSNTTLTVQSSSKAETKHDRELLED